MIKPLISVVVCTYNRAKLLPDCLESLCRQTINSDLYEIIVVDNNSSDNTYQVAKKYSSNNKNIIYFLESKQGLSHARNRGWREAKGDYVAYIDDDAKASSDWIEKLLFVFVNVSPKPVAVGGRIFPWYEAKPPDWFIDDFEIRTWGESEGFLQYPEAQSGFSGSNMAFRKETLRQSGGFSHEFGMVGNKMRMGEESELFMRLYSSSPLFWYDPEIKVFHWVPVQNTTVSYRFKRAYRGGVSYAQRIKRKVFSRRFLKTIAELFWFLIQVPFVLIKNGGIKPEVVRKVEGVGGRLGFLFARN